MISTHVLDTSLGLPAQAIAVKLEKKSGSNWQSLKSEQTNNDGRAVFQIPAEAGEYRLVFQVEDYFKKHSTTSFYVTVPVEFKISDLSRKYHVPLLLSPYGYSTYRGS